MGDPWDDYDGHDEDEDDFCPTCQGRGYIPALDFEAIEGHEGFACEDCERGNNSNYPYREGKP